METIKQGRQLGIFWLVPDRGKSVLVVDSVALQQAEAYGECLTYPRGHHEVWEEWRSLRTAGLDRKGLPSAIASHEYEEFPRGRIVYENGTHLFVIYADRKMFNPAIIQKIVERFELTGETWVVRSDAHYHT